MNTLKSKKSIILYGCSAIGVNLLNLFMSSYLCSALLVGGFGEAAIPFQTFKQKDLVIAGVWAVFVLIAKIVDGVVDIPMAAFTDKLKSRFGRRRPSIIMGMIPMILSFIAFTVYTPVDGVSMINTVYYGVLLCIFYSSYTLTMVTYYATFTEIIDNAQDRTFLSNVKSVCDIVYFIIGYVAVSALLKGINIRIVALILLPLVLTMLIPLFMIKEKSTLGDEKLDFETVNLGKSLLYTLKNKDFIIWMLVYSFMTFGVQLFLGGINEYFSFTKMSMILVMVAAFAPVPFTLMIYNKLIRKKGFRFAFQYVLLVFSASMLTLFGISFIPAGTLKTVLSIVGGLIASLGIGALFAVAYSIPSQLAADDEKRTGISHSAMYFAVQGLFSGVATGLGAGVVLTALKGSESSGSDAIIYLTAISALGCLIAYALTFILPASIKNLGKTEKQ